MCQLAELNPGLSNVVFWQCFVCQEKKRKLILRLCLTCLGFKIASGANSPTAQMGSGLLGSEEGLFHGVAMAGKW